MTRRSISVFTPVGLLALVAGIFLRLFTHAKYSEFAAGFLIGLSLVLIIAGLVRQRRNALK